MNGLEIRAPDTRDRKQLARSEGSARAKQKRIEVDLATFRVALNVYRIDAATYPSTEQGLDALVKKPTVGRIPKNWQQTLKKPQLDPWGQEYRYRFPPKHNEAEPDIWSVGKDGVDGTEDDVGNW